MTRPALARVPWPQGCDCCPFRRGNWCKHPRIAGGTLAGMVPAQDAWTTCRGRLAGVVE